MTDSFGLWKALLNYSQLSDNNIYTAILYNRFSL